MKRPQTKFHADTITDSKVELLGENNFKFVISSKFIFRSNFSCSTVFFYYQYLLKLQLI